MAIKINRELVRKMYSRPGAMIVPPEFRKTQDEVSPNDLVEKELEMGREEVLNQLLRIRNDDLERQIAGIPKLKTSEVIRKMLNEDSTNQMTKRMMDKLMKPKFEFDVSEIEKHLTLKDAVGVSVKDPIEEEMEEKKTHTMETVILIAAFLLGVLYCLLAE